MSHSGAAVKDIVENRNARSVWNIATQPYSGAHFANVSGEVGRDLGLLAGSRSGDIVFDPFVGSGTVLRVATRLQRKGVGCDLNFKYLSEQARKRMYNVQVEMQYHDHLNPPGDPALPAEQRLEDPDEPTCGGGRAIDDRRRNQGRAGFLCLGWKAGQMQGRPSAKTTKL
ncbi:MAG: site-specific DNA-methyltransferase [Acidobacteria bacterium]|nr:site-specific DNA-methyltransferase [Acidobacteriota bacterium]